MSGMRRFANFLDTRNASASAYVAISQVSRALPALTYAARRSRGYPNVFDWSTNALDPGLALVLRPGGLERGA